MNPSHSEEGAIQKTRPAIVAIWNSFSTALSFLSVLPLPRIGSTRISPGELGSSFSFFPIAGLIIAACCALPAGLLASRAPTLLLSAIMTALLAILTRALHMDGLADLADGVGGGYTRERRLEIMKDSRTGAFGALSLALAVALKVAAIQPLVAGGHWRLFLLVPALSRYAMVAAAFKSTYARPEGGLGKPFLEHLELRHLAVASLFSAALTLILAPFQGLLLFALAPIIAMIARSFSSRTLGGITGDVLGATNEIAEVILFSVAACLANP